MSAAEAECPSAHSPSRGDRAATITIATQSPRGSMAPLHAAARRAVEYFDDAPLMDNEPRERPSLLAYNRPTWRAMAPPAAPLAKTRYSQSPRPFPPRDSARISRQTSSGTGYATDDDDRYSEDRSSYYTSDEDSPYYAHPRLHPQFDELGGLDEETKDEEAHSDDDDDDEVDLLEAPKPADVPLLEIDEEDPEQDVDTILGDLTRLPRTTIIDENGFLVDPRASLSHPAAIGAMGLGVSRPGVVIKSGLLFKQGFGFLNGGWKVRHVELTSTKISFFKGENGRKRGEIDLATCSLKSIEIMPRDSVFDGAQATMWRFAIKTKGRRILMSAYSEADMKEWLRCLHVALAVQSSGAGRYTDLVVPNGTLLANKGDGLMRASGSGLPR